MRVDGGQVWDRVRRKWVALTPEEHVRATFVDYLIDHCAVSPALMATEFSVRISGRILRADIVVFSPSSIKPLMLVECKAADITLDQGVVSQACAYNSSLGARFIVLTNGRQTYAYDMLKKSYVKDIRAMLDCKSDK